MNLKVYVSFLIVGTAAVTINAQTTAVELARQLLRDDSEAAEMVRAEGWSINEVARRLTIDRKDLNGDGRVDSIITGLFCGNVNCPVYLYRTVGKRSVSIPFDESVIGVPQALTARTNGYRDLKIHYHGGADSYAEAIYRYDGTRYRARVCTKYSRGYVDRAGTFRLYKKPIVVSRGR